MKNIFSQYQVLFAMTILLFSQHSNASSMFMDEVDGRFDMGGYIAENAHGFLPVPIIITEPAVGYGGGLVGVFMHESAEEKQKRKQAALEAIDGGAKLIPSAITVAGAAGTQNGTWFAFGGHRRSWNNDAIRYIGGAGAGSVNLDIYQSLSTLEQQLPAITSDRFGFNTKTTGGALLQKLQFRLGDSPLMLGMKQFAGYSSVESDNDIIDKILELILGKDNMLSGLGVIAEYDTRDNIFYPKQGYKIEAEYMIYDEKIGSDSNYDQFTLDAEVFLPVAEKWTLALAGNYQKFDTDDLFVTPTAKPYIDLRGVSAYRYQGDEVSTVQAQINYAIDHRWVVSTFYGIGTTEQSSELSKDESIDAYGVGFRYQIARRYGLFMGVDIAKSKDDSAFYITVGSGF
ncbi:BamA/TamA family outer membrane protein [Shewanella maritima]|uniref:BamA/TamA family outer membrane protein n=1 Tax=Shewanella maritima TaxID=2520507 RepID=UPI003735949F